MSGPHSLYVPGAVELDFFPRASAGTTTAAATRASDSRRAATFMVSSLFTAFDHSQSRLLQCCMRHKTAAILAIALAFAASSAQALYFSPTRANPAGGDVIRISLDNTQCPSGCRKAPEIRFDLAPALGVTLIDPYTLDVVTPPHATGVVDVLIDSVPYHWAFAFEVPREA